MKVYLKEIGYLLDCLDQDQDVRGINYTTNPAIIFNLLPQHFKALYTHQLIGLLSVLFWNR